MPTLRLDIVVLPTYNTYNMAVVDASTYPTDPPVVVSPTLQIDIPGFATVYKTFNVQEANVYNSTDLGITTVGNESSLPDGVYHFKYTVNPAYTYYVEKTILRIDKLQEKYDEAFMQLDMMECDRAIKTQAKVDLMSIYFIIQGAVAAANNCATVQSGTLYMQANKMLDNMIANDCGCSGNNFLINFQ
jgi:hypothetical protein